LSGDLFSIFFVFLQSQKWYPFGLEFYIIRLLFTEYEKTLYYIIPFGACLFVRMGAGTREVLLPGRGSERH